jgi:hypothetical protein
MWGAEVFLERGGGYTSAARARSMGCTARTRQLRVVLQDLDVDCTVPPDLPPKRQRAMRTLQHLGHTVGVKQAVCPAAFPLGLQQGLHTHQACARKHPNP